MSLSTKARRKEARALLKRYAIKACSTKQKAYLGLFVSKMAILTKDPTQEGKGYLSLARDAMRIDGVDRAPLYTISKRTKIRPARVKPRL